MIFEDAAERRRWAGSAIAAILVHMASLAAAVGWIVPLNSAAPPQASAIMLDLPPPPEPPPPEPPPPEPKPPEPPPPPKVQPPPPKPPPPKPVSEVAPPLPEPPPPPPEVPPAAAAIAAPVAPAPSIRTPSPGEVTWQDRLLAHLENNKRYPREAQARRQEGISYVRFVMDRKGSVLSVELRTSAGSAALDEEALALIKRAQPLPVPPDDMPGETLRLTVPIEFFIRRR